MPHTPDESLTALRVLVVATTFPRWTGDSEPRFVFDLSRRLAKKVRLWVLAPHAPGARLREEMDGVTVLRFPYFFPKSAQTLCYEGGILPKLKTRPWACIQLPFFLLSLFFAIWQAVRQHRINFIHCHWIIPQGGFVAFLSAIKKIPYILTAHGGDVFAFSDNPIVATLRKYALSGCKQCLVNSHATLDAIQPVAPDTRFGLIPNGIDVEQFNEKHRDDQLKKELQVEGVLILGVGRFVEKKGFKYLIEAMPSILQQHPTARLALIGFGPEENRLKQQAQTLNLGDKVLFPGAKSGAALARFYASADIFVGPSIVVSGGDTEGQGVVFLEAMASKTAVVATRVGGITDMIRDGDTGLLAPEKNPAALAHAIARLCADGALRQRLASAGCDLVRAHYSLDTMAERYLETYREIARQRTTH
jgi:glycosyltransferase involved in cell wall biosynthesis